jgi:hypothetical protein
MTTTLQVVLWAVQLHQKVKLHDALRPDASDYPPNLLATLADLMCQQIAEANNCLHFYTLLSILN